MPELILDEPKEDPRLVLDEPVSPRYGSGLSPDFPDLPGFELSKELRDKAENSLYYSTQYGIPPEMAFDMEPELKEQAEKLDLMSDIEKAIYESPENIKIGTIGLASSTMFAIKRRAMMISGGGIFPDEMVKHQFEPVKPMKREDLPNIPGMIRPMTKDWPTGTLAEAFGLVTRLPHVAGTILQKEQQKLAEAQDQEIIRTAPITKAMRSVTQSGVPSMGAALGIALLTGDPTVALALLGEMEGGSAFQTQLEGGASIMKANVIGNLSEVAEIGGEMMVLPKIFKGVKEGFSLREAFASILENATQEGITGFNQRFLEVFGLETTKGMDSEQAAIKALNEGVKAIPENAWVGGASAGGAVVLRGGFDLVVAAKETVSKTGAEAVAKPIAVEKAPTEAIPATERPVEAITTPEALITPTEGKVAGEALAEKQPYQMIQEEFANYEIPMQYGEKAKEVWPENQNQPDWKEHHKWTIQGAIERGKVIPRKVLEEYKGEPWADKLLAEAEKGEETPVSELIFRGIHPTEKPSEKTRHRWWTTIPDYAVQYSSGQETGQLVEGGKILIARKSDIPESYIQGEAEARGISPEEMRESINKIGSMEIALAPLDKAETITPLIEVDANKFRQAIKEGKIKTLQDIMNLVETPAPMPAEAGGGVTEAAIKVAEEPERKVSRAAQRIQEEAIAKDLAESLGELPTYETMPMKEQARMAAEEINRDYENAKQMAYGKIAPPSGLRPASIYRAVAVKARTEGDVETLRNLAVVHPQISLELTAMGQAIKAADVGTLADPVKAMQDIQKTREKAVQKKRKIKDVKKQTRSWAKDAKTEIRKQTTHRQSWSEFVESIRC